MAALSPVCAPALLQRGRSPWRTPAISRPIGMGMRSNWILLYTDGVTEAENAVGLSFGDLSLECYGASR
jgi:hypothetical protein